MTRFFLVLLIALPFSLFSQDYAGLTKAFSHGDASAIANMFAEQVELSIENDVVSESAIDSQKELRTYFMNNTPQSFKMVHNGVSGKNVHYMIGELTTSKGGSRITTYLVEKGETFEIQSIEIEAN
ncbi:MAG: DUF4783 domain-containing protein [Flavobacteriales bacterium]|nr:DUF4783 domain-containing protein [Flavobacteriales bacterium]